LQLWKSYNIKTVADLDLRLNSFRVQFAYNSAKIENPEVTYHATREVFEKCYTFLLPKIIAKEPLTLSLIIIVNKESARNYHNGNI